MTIQCLEDVMEISFDQLLGLGEKFETENTVDLLENPFGFEQLIADQLHLYSYTLQKSPGIWGK